MQILAVESREDFNREFFQNYTSFYVFREGNTVVISCPKEGSAYEIYKYLESYYGNMTSTVFDAELFREELIIETNDPVDFILHLLEDFSF
jgi:hypothetical protein